MESIRLSDSDITPTRWGGYKQISTTDEGAEKLLLFSPGCGVSLQTHKRRSELWKGVSGTGYLYLGKLDDDGNQLFEDSFPVFGEKITVTRGETVRIACGQAHMNLARKDEDFIVHETWTFTDTKFPSDEKDIIRFADPFNKKEDSEICREWLM